MIGGDIPCDIIENYEDLIKCRVPAIPLEFDRNR